MSNITTCLTALTSGSSGLERSGVAKSRVAETGRTATSIDGALVWCLSPSLEARSSLPGTEIVVSAWFACLASSPRCPDKPILQQVLWYGFVVKSTLAPYLLPFTSRGSWDRCYFGPLDICRLRSVDQMLSEQPESASSRYGANMTVGLRTGLALLVALSFLVLAGCSGGGSSAGSRWEVVGVSAPLYEQPSPSSRKCGRLLKGQGCIVHQHGI